MGTEIHARLVPSRWVTRFAALPAGRTALDLACGSGRHARWLAQRGVHVTAVDRDADAVAALAQVPGVEALCADLEAAPWPLTGRRFDAVIVTNYLHRPLFDAIAAAVAPGGRLVYETFALGQARFGRPGNPDFLLAPGELLHAFGGRFHVLAYEDGIDARPARVQRLAALRIDPRAVGAEAGDDGSVQALALGADVESAA